MRPLVLVSCALLRVDGVTRLHHSSQDASLLQTDRGLLSVDQFWEQAFQHPDGVPHVHPDELAVAAVDQAYMVDRASDQKIADAEEEAGALADIAARSAAKATADAGWAALAAQTTEAAVQATQAAQKAQEALAARAAEKVQMAAQVAQAAVAHREDQINLERSHLELQAQQKAQLAFQVAEAAVAHREERIHLERSDLEVQTEQKAQVAAQVAQAALAERAERSNLEQNRLELQAAIAHDNLQAEQKAQAAIAQDNLQAEQKAQAVIAQDNLQSSRRQRSHAEWAEQQKAHAVLAAQAEQKAQAAIAQDNLEAEQKAQAAIAQDHLQAEQKARAALAVQAEPKAVGDNVRPKDRNSREHLLYPYTRHVLSPEQSGDGVCLDGSPPGFYYSPAPADSKHNNSWVLYLAGGAWCTDKDSCLVRSKTELGTSTVWGATLPRTSMKSWLSSDPEVSQFHDYHKVVLMYCDGASFSGHVDNPVTVGKEKVYFRGRLVLAALIRELIGLGLGAPKQEVLLSGGSAGGLAAILQGDRVRAMLPLVARFKVLSFAGWFRTDTAACYDAAECPWLEVMRHAHVLHQMRSSSDVDSQVDPNLNPSPSPNSSRSHSRSPNPNPNPHANPSPNPTPNSHPNPNPNPTPSPNPNRTQVETDCLREHGWQCMHARLAAQRMEAPLFLVQSSLDAWQLANIWRGATLSNGTIDTGSCVGSVYEATCHPEEIHELNGFATESVADISAGLLVRAGNGAFITNCLQHNVADVAAGDPAGPTKGSGGDEWGRFSAGNAYELAGVKTADAISHWWDAPSDTPAAKHTHMSNCSLSTHAPYQCNPSCRASQSMPKYAQVTAILKPDIEGACGSTCTCEPNLRVGPVPEELVSEWVLGSLGGGGGSWVRSRGLVGAWARG